MKVVVFCRDHLGDAVNSTGLLYGIRELFPKAEIVVESGKLASLIFEKQPSIDRCIIRPERQGILGKIKGIWIWRREKFDVAIALDDSNGFVLKAFLAGVTKRFGISRGRKYLNLYTGKVNIDYLVHEVRDNGQNLLNFLGCTCDYRMQNICVPTEMKTIEKYLNDHQIVLHFGASEKKRMLEIEDQRLIVSAVHKLGMSELVIGSGKDLNQAKALGFNTLSKVLHPLELVDLISQSKYFIGTDSGPAQIAGAFEIPGIVLYGPSNPKNTLPYGKQLRIVKLNNMLSDSIETIFSSDFSRGE